MKNEKIKIEIDLIRDSLRNIFIVMFAIMSGEVSLFYKIFHNNYNLADLIMIILGFVGLYFLVLIKKRKNKEIKNLLKRMDK
jgi:hypothetical protein